MCPPHGTSHPGISTAEVCDSHRAHVAPLALSTLRCSAQCTRAGGNGAAAFPHSSCQPLLNTVNAFSFRPVAASPPNKLHPKMAQILSRSPSLSLTLPLQHKLRAHRSPPPCLSQAGADGHQHTSAAPKTPPAGLPQTQSLGRAESCTAPLSKAPASRDAQR